MFDLLQSGVAGLRAAVEQLDAATLTGEQATAALSLFAEAERLACAGRTLVAKRVDETGAWAKSGHPSAASWMADQAGTTVGAAIGMLQTSWNLRDQPALDDALRAGELSATEANDISEAAKADPTAEEDLIRTAKKSSVKKLRERCNRVKANAESEADRDKRLRQRRCLRLWTERDGMLAFSGRLTPLDGAAFRAAIDAATERIFREHRRDGTFEPRERYAADALMRLISGVADEHNTSQPDAGANAPQRSDPAPSERTTARKARTRTHVRIRVDLAALRRGYVAPGEQCDAEGTGPISVADVLALIDDADTIVDAVAADGENIVSISRVDRHIPAKLRVALEERDPCCVAPGCDRSDRLEIDHLTPFAQGGRTELDNLARLCHHHHALKTTKRWRLSRGPDSTWMFEPPADRAAQGP